MAKRRTTRFGVAVSAAALVLSLSASVALGGEITGNGKSLKNADGTLNGRSHCAYSGQEDLQFADPANPTKGVPAHSQSWGQINFGGMTRQETRAFLTSIGSNPGIACNPTKAQSE